MSLDLLCVAAHPDDAELSCGGLLALSASRGQSTGIVDLSAGELATHGTVEERAKEAAAAAEVLGLATRRQLGLPDGGIDSRDASQVDALVALIRELRPGLCLAPHTEARHPDHAAAGALTQRAVFLAGLAKHRPELGVPHRPRVLVYPQRHEVRPDLVVDVTGVHPTKWAAIRCHASQFGHGDTMVGASLGLSAFDVRDRYWGATIGVAYGEPYLLGGPVPVADPVALLSGAPSPVLVPGR